MTEAIGTLRTKRLLLRQFEERDKQPFSVLNSDPMVMEYLGGPMSRESSDTLAIRAADLIRVQGWGFWAVEIAEVGEFAGFVGLNRPRYETPFTPCLEVGWRLGRPYWGRGYATEAALAALNYAFTRLDDGEVVSFTSVDNWRSRKVMERLGMQYDVEGDFDHPELSEDDPQRRHVLYRLTKQQWESESWRDAHPPQSR